MNWRKVKDNLVGRSMHLAAAFANSIVFLILIGLWVQSKAILAKKSIFDLLLSSSWHPLKGDFGFFPFIVGTLEVTALAMILAVPVCLLSAICGLERGKDQNPKRNSFGSVEIGNWI